MEFHPGGIPELMRAAGKDGTEFFDEVKLHPMHPYLRDMIKNLISFVFLD